MKITYHKHIKSQGWFLPMYRMQCNGKVYYQSPTKITTTRLSDIVCGKAKPVLFTWDNRLWFK